MENNRGISRKLLSPEREERILAALGDGLRTITELSTELGVSEATIRRDLQSLERRALAARVHGGAVRADSGRGEPLFHEKTNLRAAQKEEIAERALALIEENDVIYLDGGSTVLALARRLGAFRQLTVVTNSLMAASELMESGHKLILIGGEFRPLSRTMVGPLTQPAAEALTIGKAFLGTIGITESGLWTTDPGEAFTKKLIMRRSETVILLADSGKFGRTSLAESGALGDLDIVITDRDLSGEYRKLLKKQKIEVVTQ